MGSQLALIAKNKADEKITRGEKCSFAQKLLHKIFCMIHDMTIIIS